MAVGRNRRRLRLTTWRATETVGDGFWSAFSGVCVCVSVFQPKGPALLEVYCRESTTMQCDAPVKFFSLCHEAAHSNGGGSGASWRATVSMSGRKPWYDPMMLKVKPQVVCANPRFWKL